MISERNQEMQLVQNSVAMTVTLCSFAMLFATMFLGYFLVRSSVSVWPPVEIQGMPQGLPFFSTLVMLLSSVTYYFFEHKEQGRKINFLLTIVLGLAFLVSQWLLWGSLEDTGILVSDGMVPSMVYAFTWLHAAHIALALLLLVWLGFYVFFKTQNLTVIKVINVGKFWHFLGVVWLLMYLLIFVI